MIGLRFKLTRPPRRIEIWIVNGTVDGAVISPLAAQSHAPLRTRAIHCRTLARLAHRDA